MSNMIYACWREAQEAFGARILERVADQIAPGLLRGQPHRILDSESECLCLTGPVGAAQLEGKSAHLGAFTGVWKDWHMPGSPVPEGSFALVRSNGVVTELCTDAVGSRTIWYVFTERHLLASTSQRALVCLLQSLSINPAAFAWFLSSGTLGPSDSWDRRIQRLPPGARLLLDHAEWSMQLRSTPVTFAPRSMSEAEGLEGLREVLWKAINGCDIKSPWWILPLSGGYDSRLLLAVLNESGFQPRTVTWGMASSRTQHGNDACVAQQLARHYGLANDYFLTEMSEDPPAEVVDTFLAAHGGTTDELFPYLDGLKLWSRFTAEGVGGIIRGDEGFGVDPRPEAYHRFSQGLILLEDFLYKETAEAISDGRQSIPEELKRQPGESVQTYGDRLLHAFFIPVSLAALSDVKAPFVEIANPMLSRSVLEFVRQMPDAMRARRSLYERLTEASTPRIPFAVLAAVDNQSGYLFSGGYRKWILEELEGGFAQRMLPHPFREILLASMLSNSSSLLQSSSMRTTLKRVLPKSWIIAVRAWRRPNPPPLRVLAFRCALASRLVRMLGQDSALLLDPGNPSRVVLEEAWGRTSLERGSPSPASGPAPVRKSLGRLSAFLDDVVHAWRKDGYRASFKLLKTRVYERTDTLLYELRVTGKEPEVPADWHIAVVRSAEDIAGVEMLCRSGGESEVRQFRRNAVAYVLSIGGESVAHAWYYPNNALARRMGPNAAYFGSMFVLPEWRGRGIQGLLNAYMASLLPPGTRILMEILATNVASQKGVVKGKAVFIGRLDMIVFLGRIVRAHVATPSDRRP